MRSSLAQLSSLFALTLACAGSPASSGPLEQGTGGGAVPLGTGGLSAPSQGGGDNGGAGQSGATAQSGNGGSPSGGGASPSSGGSPAGGAATGESSGGTAGGATASSGGENRGGANNGGAVGAGSGSGGAASAGAATGGAPAQSMPPDWPLVNGIQWADSAGNPIQAHGGGVIRVDGYYYWFGENRNPDGTFYAVSAYRSQDLVRWEFVAHVLRESLSRELDPANIERPKVVYNASTKQYVMWMHWENGSNYGEARAAVASSSSITGDYTYHGSFRPLADSGVMDHGKPGYMSRDCTLFVDDDGKAYFISASNENYDLNLYQLTPDYLKIERLVAVLFKGGHREAPALFKREGVYFLLTSGATGWDPNQAQYATSKSLASGWSSLSNVGDGTTFHSQSTFVLPVQGSGATGYLYLGDRWAGAWGGRVNDSTYVWQPITFASATSMSMSWKNTLVIDATAGSVTGQTNNFHFLNVKSGKALDVAGGSGENGAKIVQNPESSAESQAWSLNYDGAGYFHVTNAKSGKILDVLDESTADGAGLAQWENHDGDNQAWSLVDVGNGRFKLKNKKSNKFVGVVDASTADGAATEQRAAGAGEEQQWKLVVAK